MKSIIPRLFGSKRTGRESSESDGDGDLGMSLSLSLSVSVSPSLTSLIFFPFIDLEKKIAQRKKAFMEAAPLMRKSFSGMLLIKLIRCNNNLLIQRFQKHTMLWKLVLCTYKNLWVSYFGLNMNDGDRPLTINGGNFLYPS